MPLIYNVQELPCAVDVQDWSTHGLTFTTEQENNYSRKNPPWLLVFHWTGGEGDCEAVYNTLMRRELGIHFYIDYDGSIHQYCDPALIVCAHAGYANKFSIGVEMQNRGYLPSKVQFPRSSYVDKLHGRTERMLYFREAQVKAALALSESFVQAGIIERRVPRDPKMPPNTCGSLLRSKLSRKDLIEFRGVCGHFHISKRKTDPGTDLLEAFIDAGY